MRRSVMPDPRVSTWISAGLEELGSAHLGGGRLGHDDRGVILRFHVQLDAGFEQQHRRRRSVEDAGAAAQRAPAPSAGGDRCRALKHDHGALAFSSRSAQASSGRQPVVGEADVLPGGILGGDVVHPARGGSGLRRTPNQVTGHAFVRHHGHMSSGPWIRLPRSCRPSDSKVDMTAPSLLIIRLGRKRLQEHRGRRLPVPRGRRSVGRWQGGSAREDRTAWGPAASARCTREVLSSIDEVDELLIADPDAGCGVRCRG